MTKFDSLIPRKRIERSIILLRGQKVMLDADLAVLYGIPTKALKQAVKRNHDRFPLDFMFELTEEEKTEVVTNCDHLAKLKFSPYLPYAFTEYGALMLANVLNNPKAIQVSIQIIRTFISLRKLVGANKDLTNKLWKIGEKHDQRVKIVLKTIQQLQESSSGSSRRMELKIEEPKAIYLKSRKT